MKNTLRRFCLYALASTFLLFSTLNYAMADYAMTNGCGNLPVCTGTGWGTGSLCSRLECYTSVPCLDTNGNWAVYANSSYIYTKKVPPPSSASKRGIAPNAVIQCVGSYQSGYQETGSCCN